MKTRRQSRSILHWVLYTAPAALLLTAPNLHAEDGMDPNAMGGLFGSVMGTSLTVAAGALGLAALGVLVVAVPWVMHGGRDVWDERRRRRGAKEDAWSVPRREQYNKTHRQHS